MSPTDYTDTKDAITTMTIMQKAAEEMTVEHILCMSCPIGCKQYVPVLKMRYPLECKTWKLKSMNKGEVIKVDYPQEKTTDEKKEEIVEAMIQSDQELKRIMPDFNTFTYFKHLRKKQAIANQRIESLERRMKYAAKCMGRILASQKNFADLIGSLVSTDEDVKVNQILTTLNADDGQAYLDNMEGNVKDDKAGEAITPKKEEEKAISKEASLYNPDDYPDADYPNCGIIRRCISCIASSYQGYGRKKDNYASILTCNEKRSKYFGQKVEWHAGKCKHFTSTNWDRINDTKPCIKLEKKVMGIDLSDGKVEECQE